jgi:hypothetical protein
MRLSVDGPEELAGFPKTRDELFAYRGIILSIEAGAFTGDQLRMIRSSSSAAARSRGRLARSARAMPGRRWPTLPVVVERVARSSTIFRCRASRSGRPAPAKRMPSPRSPPPRRPRARWNELPVLTSVNPLKSLGRARRCC